MKQTDSSIALDRADQADPSTWRLEELALKSLEGRCLAGLRAKGYPATSVEMDPTKLKGGYICDTMRVFIGYAAKDSPPISPTGVKASTVVDFEPKSAREEATARAVGDKSVEWHLPRSVTGRPATAILKMASPLSSAAARRTEGPRDHATAPHLLPGC